MALKIPSQKVSSRSGLGSRSSLLSAVSLIRSRSKIHGGESRSRLRTGSRIGFDGGDGDGDEWLQAKDPQKPENQLDLTEEELKEEFTRIIRGDNPHAPDNIVRFSFKEMEYKQLATVEQVSMHFAMDGNLIHVDSDEARRQQTRSNLRGKKPSVVDSGTDAAPPQEDKTDADNGDEGEAATADGGTDAGTDTGTDVADTDVEVAAESSSQPPKKLRNQFNFSERASQSFNYTQKEKSSMTEPTPRATFSANATQWVIYDTYMAQIAAKKAANEKAKKVSPTASTSGAADYATPSATADESTSMWTQAAKIVDLEHAKKLERLVVQNSFDAVAQDFKFWDDEADQFKSEGSVLPLWKFVYADCKKKANTCLSFNPKYHDLVIAGFGSYEYGKSTEGGVIACYSFKNHLHPEYIIKTESGVLSIDTLESSVHIIVVGFMDGSVAVYDLSDATTRQQPTHISTALTGKHTDPVWQVKWQEDDLAKRHTFFSVSGDGHVRAWTLMLNELLFRDVITLQVGGAPDNAHHSGTCMAFNAAEKHLYLVGTEEGQLMKCSKAYTSRYLATYEAHTMAIYSVSWNPFHHNVFATASADWSVKVWDHEYETCLFEFDLGGPVGEVAWAPYSSTMFAAVTSAGFLFVFDLGISKTEPICSQQIIKKGKLTHLAFNDSYPVVVVGDDRGNINSLKLSPNLRKNLSAKGGINKEAEKEKLEKLLDSMKELDIQTGKPLVKSTE
eukprot:m.609812 g.609812  ORF g.609812 m.609812 type:complete len:731 (+) comp22491_c0_seq1:156-2348(+)